MLKINSLILLNCAKTSQYIHISFNNNYGIISPDIFNFMHKFTFFQEEIFKLLKITRCGNMYC